MAAFGTLFMPEMALTTFDNQAWAEASFVPSNSIQMHPGAHVLHYSSTCFEGLKAFRHEDGGVIFSAWTKTSNVFSKALLYYTYQK